MTKRQIGRALELAPHIIAADGGLGHVFRAGLEPELVIGDFDSASGRDLARVLPEKLRKCTDQDSTDFEKCLSRIAAPFAVALGMFGSRLDHGLAALNALVAHQTYPVLALSGKDVVFRCPPELRLNLPVATRLSLFPLAPVRGRSAGLSWPIDGMDFSPVGRIGTSNRTCERTVRLWLDGPSMLAILPARHLPEAVRAVRATI
ncbi:MAG: thiamine diphosphokinase [Paracoccaceae bacterium]